MNNLPDKAIRIQRPALCHHCADPSEIDVSVVSIEQRTGNGWKLDGKGKVYIECQCPVCGMIYTAVKTAIPIECYSYSCPTCNETLNLEYKVCKIEPDNNDFSFEAEIFCKKCHGKTALAQVLKKILNIKKIEIKLTGITIERFST